jgi:hypothetical protein
MQPICQAPGCRSRAFGGSLCSFHALEALRLRRGVKEQTARGSSRTRRELKSDAARLGITLAETVPAVVARVGARKPRSPVA